MLTMETGEPALTDRLVLVKDDDVETRCGAAGDASYGVGKFINNTMRHGCLTIRVCTLYHTHPIRNHWYGNLTSDNLV